jgi:hypothetical protein
VLKYFKYLSLIATLIVTPVLADSVLVIDAQYDQVTNNVKGRLEAAGHTVTITTDVSQIPTVTSTHQQVWDLRYAAALTAGEQSAYQTYVTNGGFAYFVTENPGCCQARNDSVAALVTALGGGTTTIGANFAMTNNVSSNVNTTYMTSGITVNYAAVSAIVNSQGIPLISDGAGAVSGMSWIGRAGALGSGVTGTIVTVADTNWLDASRFNTSGTTAQQQNVTALDDIIRGIVAGTVGGTISANGNGAAASNGGGTPPPPTPVGQPTITTIRGPASTIYGTWTPYASTQTDARTNSGKNGVITRTINRYEARTLTNRVVVTPVSNQLMSDGTTVSTNGNPYDEDTAGTAETRLASTSTDKVMFPRTGFVDYTKLRSFNPFLIDPFSKTDGAWISPNASWYKTTGNYSTGSIAGGYQWTADGNIFGAAINYGGTNSSGLTYSKVQNEALDGVVYTVIKDNLAWVKASVGFGYGKISGSSSIPIFALSNTTKFNQKTIYGDLAIYSPNTFWGLKPFVGATILNSSLDGIDQQGSPLLSTVPETKNSNTINPYFGVRYDIDKNFGIETRIIQSKDFNTVGSFRALAKTEIASGLTINASVGFDKSSNLTGVNGTIGLKYNF